MKDWKKLIDDDERAVENVLNPPSKRHVVAVSLLPHTPADADRPRGPPRHPRRVPERHTGEG